MKESKKEALATHLPKKSSKSKPRGRPPSAKIPAPSDLPPPPKTKPKNTEIIKEDLITKILKYQNNKRFGTIINKELGFKYTRPQLTKQSIDSLETILHRIRTHLNTRNMDQVFEHMAKVTAKGYEDLVSGFGYNIEGFQEILFQNPAFHDAFERWKIERKIPDIPPSFQLMYIVASTTYIAHLQNKAITATHQIKQEPPKKPLPKKQDDTIIVDDPRLKSTYKVGDVL